MANRTVIWRLRYALRFCHWVSGLARFRQSWDIAVARKSLIRPENVGAGFRHVFLKSGITSYTVMSLLYMKLSVCSSGTRL